MKRLLSLLILSALFAQIAFADGGTTILDLSKDLLKTRNTEISLETNFGIYQVKTSELKRLMSESGPKMSAKDILSQTLIGETNVTVEQSQDINLIGLPADYTAQILTLTSADLVKQGANSMALDRGSIKTRHMLLIDCQCE